MTTTLAQLELVQRLERVEARLAIGELPARYALAVDSRDIDGWLGLFVADVNCGTHGQGREALRKFIEPNLRTFYRSVHQVCGQTIDFLDDDTATGTVYCRAEHEDGDQWIVMAIIYFDKYVRREGRWFFERRRERHWYAADIVERPRPPFQLWDANVQDVPTLPKDFPSWDKFWQDVDGSEINRLTRQP